MGCGNRNNERPGCCGALVVANWLDLFLAELFSQIV
jgi:hypothetical protein